MTNLFVTTTEAGAPHRTTAERNGGEEPSIDPRNLLEREGIDALAEILAGAGYLIQRRLLIDLAHALRSRKPLLIEGPRGGGKT